jgi:hypothetical protein
MVYPLRSIHPTMWKKEDTIAYAPPMAHPQPDPAMEKQALKSHAEALQSKLDAVKSA